MLIGEVARRSGVSARMLRHYDSLGLVRPTGRTGGGYREYADEDIRRIFHVESLRSLGLSLQEVGRALDDPGFAPSKLVDDLIRRTRERIAAETALLTRLSRIDAAEPAGWEDVLQVVALLQGLGSESAGKRQRAALYSGSSASSASSASSGSSAKEAAVPVEALVEAALSETDPHVAGALRWALAQSGDEGLALLAEGLGSPVAAVRRRAVRSVAEFPGGEATALLRDALTDSDVVVRRCAALALGARGVADAVPTLVAMVVDGANDVDAADALRTLATGPATPDLSAPTDRPAPPDRTTSPDQIVSPDRTTPADRIAAALVDRLARRAGGSSVRRRLTQALAEIPGATATQALADLSHDQDRAVALTASYVLTLRATGQDDARP
ncbi:MerR family transcriptional regulator [Streptomyces sp. NPDC060322]|uniref:MerR family transcriptional regulator n=1 Tax=Streptomyces sp. NPDC060322 TaxID=3347097 RepID=UPI003660D494